MLPRLTLQPCKRIQSSLSAREPLSNPPCPVRAWFTKLTVEIDNAFKAAALYGLYEVKSSETPKNAISLPLSSSTLVSTHLNPYLPEEYAQYNFKRTSWKKAATFLKKYMEKEGIIKTKDRSGETVITLINWNHKLIKEFKPYELGKKEDKTAAKSDDAKVMTQIQEFYKASGKVLRGLLEQQSKSL